MAKQPAGPQIMYETSSMIELDRKKEHPEKPVAPFELSENNYSSLTRLLRVTAWCWRFIQKLQKKSTEKEELKAEEINQAKTMWERHVQNSSFASEIKAIKNNTRNNLKSQLGLKVDENGIIRCHGRCRRHQGGPYRMPQMAPYPASKIEESSPFTYTGLDYLGPLYVRVNNQSATQKVWVCLFTCLAVRAVHLEVINDMSAEQFLLCLRRFISRRGKPKEIISDNASQFKLAKSTIDEAWKFATTSPDMQSYLANQGIKWSFIIELAPWMGGFYERLVGLVKQALRKVLERSV
ncbi:hypothetical protein ACROYT_G019319 [Oculina patagonica]